MSFTETTQRGCVSRIMGSFVGFLIGPILVVAAIWLLAWNEGRAVQAIVGLNDAAKSVIESSGTPTPANEGKLVHVVAQATAVHPISDSDLGLTFNNDVAINRIVEMYQWREKKEETTQDNVGGGQTKTTTYTYSQVWTDEPVDSTTFTHPTGHTNPAMPFTTQLFHAGDAKVGGYVLDDTTLGLVELSAPLKPDAPQGWVRNGDNLYRSANPLNPVTGDLRVRYMSLPSGAIMSVMAAQSHGGFTPYVTANYYRIHFARLGNVTADAMIAYKRESERLATWLLRGVGAAMMFGGFSLLLGPLSAMASIIPFLGSIVRGAAAGLAFVLTVPLTLVTIALAWLAFRPLLGASLLILAAIAVYLLWRWHQARTVNMAPVAKPA
jgi:hypothetical protein